MYSGFLASMPTAKTLRATPPSIEKLGSNIVKIKVGKFEDALASVHPELTHPLVLLQYAAHAAANQPYVGLFASRGTNPAIAKWRIAK